MPADPRSLIIATTTFYPDLSDLHAQLASRFVTDAIAAGHRVVVVDDSSSAAVKDRFRALGALVHDQKATTMGSSRRQALAAAYNLWWKAGLPAHAENEVVVAWVEPEKYPLVPFLGKLAQAVRDGADMVIPRRRSLHSYPRYQELCELRGNWGAGTLTGRPDLDLWFGPRLMNLKAQRYFLDYRGEYGDLWDSIFIPVVRALSDGLMVQSVHVTYVHPPEQTEAEEENEKMNQKRDKQLHSLLNAMREECNKLKFASV